VPDARAAAEADSDEECGGAGGAGGAGRDLTALPSQLDAAYETYDTDAALRPTVITPSGPWRLRAQASLLARAATESVLHGPEQDTAKRAAFDLLDALSRSGALPLAHASLHVLLGATHCFDGSLMETVIQKNINPIERVERSSLIMAATLHGRPAAALLRREAAARVAAHSPTLFAATAALPGGAQ
jgi:hypothetical protein